MVFIHEHISWSVHITVVFISTTYISCTIHICYVTYVYDVRAMRAYMEAMGDRDKWNHYIHGSNGR